MKKLIFSAVALCVTAQSIAGELMTISDQDGQRFVRHLSMATTSVNRMVQENTIGGNHPMVFMLNKLSTDLKSCDSNITKMVASQGLDKPIKEYGKAVESNLLTQLAQEQLASGEGDTEYIKTYLLRTRYALSNLELSKKHPTFFVPLIGDIHGKDRVNFIRRNAAYPVSDEAFKDYIALFIYQTLFVPLM